MTIIDKIKDLLRVLVMNIHKRRKVVLALSCVVVFVTTYMLILPAFTLEKTKAAEQGGIDVPGVTTTAEEVTGDEEAAEEAGGQTDGQAVQAETGKTEGAEAEESGSEESKDSEEAKADASAETADPLTYEDEHYTIAVDDKNSVLPENTEIKVEEIDKAKDEKEYQKHFDDALAAIQEEKDGENVSDLEFARFYDISLVSDGKEVTLGKGDKVSVNIEYDKELRKALGVENKDNIRIIHFAENKDTGKVEAEVLDNKEAKVTAETTEDNLLKEAAFDAESFSVYGLVYVKEAEEEAAKAEEKTEEVEEKEEKKEEVVGVSELDLGTAVVSATDGQDLPEEAGGHAGVVDGEKAIAAVEKKVDDLDGNVEYKVFDIALENVDESAYEGFKVDVNLPEELKGRDFRLFHYHGGKVEELSLETSGTTDNNNVDTVDGFTFETEGFSQFVLSYTVDFEYEGLTFKLDGGNKMYLSELFSELGIKESVEDVKDVVFSDPTLVEVTHKTPALGFIGKEDWVLKSLKAFTSEESLIITLNNGTQFTIKVTDAQYTTDLNSLQTGISVSINGKELKDGETISIDKGDKFNLHLELAENDFYQFPDDETEMIYQLPAGITLDSATTYVTVNMGPDGKVYRNKLVYDPVTNTLRFKWNTNDPKFPVMAGNDNTKVVFDLSGSFNENATHVDFSDELGVDIEHVEHHDADIQKNGQLYLPGAQDNPYGTQPAIKYTVTVSSDGTTTVNVKDVVEGTAVTLDTTNWKAKSNKGTNISPQFSSKGFTLNNQDMQDGEVITIEYWGIVDTSGIDNLMDVSYSQTGNKVTLTGENIPKKEKTHYEHVVGQNKMSKSSTNVGSVGEDGKQTVEWKIVANSNPLESIGGSTITDRISADSRQYMSYSGTGITVVAKRADGTVASTNSYDWNTSNLTMTDTDQDKHWTFTVPNTDEALTYEITYTTEVDTTNKSGLFTVVNNTEGKPGTSSGSATVGTPEDTSQPVNYTKKAVSVNENETVWNISVNIDKNDQGYYDKFEILETLPHKAFGGKGYIDDLVSITVNEGDLKAGEHFELSDIYGYMRPDGRPTDNSYGETGEYTKRSAVKLIFYRSAGTSEPGINASENRTLNIQVVTKNNPKWLEATKDTPTSDDVKHTNEVKVNEWNTASDTAVPMAKTVIKGRNGGQNSRGVAGPSETNSIYKNVRITDTGATVVDSSKVQYPIYEFWAIVGGVTEENLEDGKLIIEDTFDDHFYVIWDEELGSHGPAFWGAANPTTNGRGQSGPNNETFEWSQTNGKVTFTINNPRKNGDSYYPYYYVSYYLAPKNEEALNYMKQKALEAGGTAEFNNVASSDGIDSELNFSYNYNVIDKSSVVEQDETASLLKYTIKINPDKLTLNNGETMTMTDTYTTNLSVDFGSISVTAVDRDGNDRSSEVTWDYSGHTGTFKIPDETYVIIKYNGRPVGDPGSVQTISNTAYMEGYFDTDTQERVVDISGEGTSERVRIRLLKFAADHMEGGLNGAEFRLLDQDMHPIIDKNGHEVTFTTGTGYLNKYGIIHAANDVLDYVDRGSGDTALYDAGVSRDDLNDEGKARWDAGTIHNPTADPAKIVTYADLSSAGMNRLGVTKHDGFAEIFMNQQTQGYALKKERVYYLEETRTPVGEDNQQYEKSNVKYSFLITDQSDYSAPGGIYVYHNNDVMTVRNWPTEEASLQISKTFTGNVELTEAQKNQVTFTIKKKAVNGEFIDFPIDVYNSETGQVEKKATFTYGDKKDAAGTPLFENGVLKITGIEAGEYRVVESNTEITDSPETIQYRTEYLVDGDKQTATDSGVTVTITDADITNKVQHDVAVTNSYFTNKYQLVKYASDTAQLLGGAKFKVVKVASDGTKTTVAENLTTDSNGTLNLQWARNSWDSTFEFEPQTLYYVVETEAPTGFVLPANPQKYYFYFSSDPTTGETSEWTPGEENQSTNPGGVPKGETAIDLAKGYGSESIPNRRDTSKTYVTVDKKWVNSLGRDITSTMTDAEAVNVNLYRTTEKLSDGTVITNGDKDNAKNASELRTLTVKNGSTVVSKSYFLPKDKVQVTVQGSGLSDASLAVAPYTETNPLVNSDTRKSWSITMPSSDTTITVDGVTGAAGVSVVNVDAANRVFVLSKSQAETVRKDGSFHQEATLNASNKWTHTFSNLDVTNTDSGMNYLYYIVEDEATSDTTYEVGNKSITVTNPAPKQLEVNKVWKNADGENINSTKTDGQIKYELYQVENVPAVSPEYSKTGTIGFDISQLYRITNNGNQSSSITGDVTDGRIKSGSNIRIEIKTTEQYNTPLTGDISVSGGNKSQDYFVTTMTTGETYQEDTPTHYGNYQVGTHKRVIIISDVTDTIRITGAYNSKGQNTQLEASLINEPTDASTDFEDLTKNKVGTVTVTYDNATLAKEAAFSDTNIRVTPGTKHWSSLVSNLPATGRNNDGLNVNYTYYVEEKSATGFDVRKAEYTNNNVAAGETIVITNQEEELPGSLIVKKAFDGFDYDSLTDAQKAALSGIRFVITGPNEYEQTVLLTDALGNGKTLEGLKAGEYNVTEQRVDATTPSGYIYKETTVKVDAGAPAQTVTATVSVPANGEATVTYTNKYEPESIDLDIVKVDRADNQPLGGAVFTLKKFSDTAPTEGGTLDYITGSDKQSDPTDATTGTTSFTGLDSGYYEVTETTRPEGYVLTGDTTFYFKVFNGTVNYITKGAGKPSSWDEASGTDYISYTAASANNNAKFTVGNDFGTELPHTGGIGTTIFYILGSILVIAGGIYFTSRRRAMKQ